MSYFIADVNAARARIVEAVPDAVFSHTDYGYGLRVADAALTKGFIVFQPQRDSIGQREVTSDDITIDAIIARLCGKTTA